MGLNTLGLGIILSLRDGASVPANRAAGALGQLDMAAQRFSSRFNTAMSTAFEGMNMVAAGALALAAPINFIKATFKTQKAMAAVASTGITEMEKMKTAAEDFTNTWAGTTQEQFLNSMYEIKSGLYELSDSAVRKMTITTGILAKATRSTMEELQQLSPIMYGILRPTRKGVTDDAFIDEFAGGLAYAVKIYRATGKYFGDAFSQATSIASLQGVSMQEQIAVLGQLQQTMTGSEAGTKLKALTIAVPKAIPAMKKYNVKGLQLTDKNDMMLPIVDILTNIRNKYGEALTATSMEELRKLFGSREATSAIANLLPSIEKLKKDSIEIKKAMNEGLPVALEMANTMSANISDTWEVFAQRVDNLRQKIGEKLTPVFGPIIALVGRMLVLFQNIADTNPWIIQMIGSFMAFTGTLLITTGALFILGAVMMMVNASFALMKERLALLGTQFLKFLLTMWPLMLIGGLLYISFKSNFMGIADVFNNFMNSVKRFVNTISLVWNGLRELISSLSGDSGMISEETKKALEDAGLWEITKKTFMMYVRLKYMWQGIKDGFKGFVVALNDIVKPIGQFLLDYLITPIANGMAKLGLGGLKELVDLIMKPTQSNADTWYKIGVAIGIIGGAFASLTIGLKIFSALASIARFIAPLFTGIWAVLRYIGIAFMWIAGLVAAILGIPVWLAAVIVAAVIALVTLIVVFRKEIWGFLVWLWEKIVNIFWIVVDSIVGFFKWLSKSISDGLSNLWIWIYNSITDVKDNIIDIWNAIPTAFQSIWEGIKTGASSFFTWIEGKFKSITDTINVIKDFFVTNATKLGTGVDKIKGIGTWVSNGVGAAAESIGWNAKGNVFGGPSIIGVGEAGNEAVIPLSGKNMLPFAQAIADVMPSSNASSGYSNGRPINNVNQGNNGSSNSSNDAILGQILQQTNSQNKTIEVPVYIDGRQVAKAVANYVDRENRR